MFLNRLDTATELVAKSPKMYSRISGTSCCEKMSKFDFLVFVMVNFKAFKNVDGSIGTFDEYISCMTFDSATPKGDTHRLTDDNDAYNWGRAYRA